MVDKKIIGIINNDKKLMLIFSGLVVDGIAFFSLLVFASVWMLF